MRQRRTPILLDLVGESVLRWPYGGSWLTLEIASSTYNSHHHFDLWRGHLYFAKSENSIVLLSQLPAAPHPLAGPWSYKIPKIFRTFLPASV